MPRNEKRTMTRAERAQLAGDDAAGPSGSAEGGSGSGGGPSRDAAAPKTPRGPNVSLRLLARLPSALLQRIFTEVHCKMWHLAFVSKEAALLFERTRIPVDINLPSAFSIVGGPRPPPPPPAAFVEKTIVRLAQTGIPFRLFTTSNIEILPVLSFAFYRANLMEMPARCFSLTLRFNVRNRQADAACTIKRVSNILNAIDGATLQHLFLRSGGRHDYADKPCPGEAPWPLASKFTSLKHFETHQFSIGVRCGFDFNLDQLRYGAFHGRDVELILRLGRAKELRTLKVTGVPVSPFIWAGTVDLLNYLDFASSRLEKLEFLQIWLSDERKTLEFILDLIKAIAKFQQISRLSLWINCPYDDEMKDALEALPDNIEYLDFTATTPVPKSDFSRRTNAKIWKAHWGPRAGVYDPENVDEVGAAFSLFQMLPEPGRAPWPGLDVQV